MPNDKIPQWAMEAANRIWRETGDEGKLEAARIIWEACREQVSQLSVHLAHCNHNENPNGCKYGELETCPALSQEWSWFGKRLQWAEQQQAEHQQQLAQADKCHEQLVEEIERLRSQAHRRT